ncbi:MAG TPA: hypothetical protein VFQ05_19040 [Candidatus Eisenbacteria bacterium]|nr:hypothetical protein [Candidatus Eisenbacteria bacterium]
MLLSDNNSMPGRLDKAVSYSEWISNLGLNGVTPPEILTVEMPFLGTIKLIAEEAVPIFNAINDQLIAVQIIYYSEDSAYLFSCIIPFE